jgi:hypothetical protein
MHSPFEEHTTVEFWTAFGTRGVPRKRAGVGLAFLVVSLVACSQSGTPGVEPAPTGGQGGGAGTDGPDGQPDTQSIPEPIRFRAESEAGWWLGKLERNGQVVNLANCPVTSAGELACELFEAAPVLVFADDPLGQAEPSVVIGGVRGTLALGDAGQAVGSGTLYAAPGFAPSDGTSRLTSFAIVEGALLDSKERLSFSLESLGELSTFSGVFDPYYNQDTGLTRRPGIFAPFTTGVYTHFDLHGDPASLSIDSDGAFFSQSATGCVFSGTVRTIDPAYNGFAIDGEVHSCADMNGVYTGFAFMVDFSYVNGYDRLDIFVFNDRNFIAAQAWKS